MTSLPLSPDPSGSRSSLLARLVLELGVVNVLTAAVDVEPYCVDWRGRYRGVPLCVVRPGNSLEVAAVIRACADAAVPVVPQGGNTGLCGGGTPVGGEVLVSLARMNHILNVDARNGTITAEAGCTLSAVKTAAEESGLLFPLSLASEGTATLGGNLSTNAGGVQVLRYGNTRELTLGLEVVLADGQCWDGLRGLRKDNTGYDLKHLFIGSEGTLGIITAATMRLYPRPRHVVTAWVALPSLTAAIDLLASIRGYVGDAVTAFELVSDVALDLVLQQFRDTRSPLAATSEWYVLLECSGGAPIRPALELALARAHEIGMIKDIALAETLSHAQAFWALRENISEAQKRRGLSIKHDVAVPVAAIPIFVNMASAALLREFPNCEIICFGHVGDGNLHFNVAFDSLGMVENSELSNRVNQIVYDHVNELHGTISAEHGIGQLKRDMIRKYKSALELQMMRNVKLVLDPLGLMNPGKLL